jgi:hypothetical protein
MVKASLIHGEFGWKMMNINLNIHKHPELGLTTPEKSGKTNLGGSSLKVDVLNFVNLFQFNFICDHFCKIFIE